MPYSQSLAQTENLKQEYSIITFIDYLTTNKRLPICFETPNLDPETQGITAREKVLQLRKQESDGSISNEARALLNSLIEVEKEHPDSVVDWKLPKFQLNPNETSLTDFKKLRELQTLIPDYEFKESNGTLLVTPKKSVLSHKVGSFEVEGVSLREAIDKLKPILDEVGIQFFEVNSRSNQFLMEKRIEKLKLENSTLAEVLLRLVQAVGPDCTWRLGGMKGSRVLTIIQL